MRIITDTASLFSPEEGKAVGISVVPTCVIHGDKVYRDYEEMQVDTLLSMIAGGATPTTSQPAIGDLLDVFEETTEETLGLFIGDGLSGGYQSAVGAKNTIDDNEYIHIVDTKTLAGAEGYLVQKAIELRNQGLNMEAIKTELEKSIESSASFVIPADFEFLKRSGRLTPIAAKISSMIKIVPVMTLTEDKKKITLFTIKRSWKKATEAIAEEMKKLGVDENYVIYICHGGDVKAAEGVLSQLKERFSNVTTELMCLSPSMLTHGGPGCVLVQAIKK